ncbi:hypothetical protein KY284_008569 [Solanum tuberosum]|nr:hypothetical protein KY284_008569 [Solanum tuberosum]
MDSQPEINVRVRASNFSGRFNYLKKNESYITSHSWEIKALILARLLGRCLNLDNMKIEILYRDEMGPDVMPLLDKKIEDRTKQASANGNVLRYVCLIDDVSWHPKDSALGRLRGSDNVVEIYIRCYEKQPSVIQGTGAGNDTTAAGVLADILDIQDLFP